MLGLSGAEEISTIKQAILIQYRIAIDGQTDKQRDLQKDTMPQHTPRLLYAYCRWTVDKFCKFSKLSSRWYSHRTSVFIFFQLRLDL